MSHNPVQRDGKDNTLSRFHRRLAAYLLAGAVLLMVLGVAASIVLGLWWSAHLTPVSDGERVLEIQRSWTDSPDAD